MDKDIIVEKYIAFRSNTVNDRFDDSVFCSENSVSLDQLKSIKTPEVLRRIFQRPVGDQEFFNLLDQLTRLCYHKALAKEIPVKSFEGLVNAITNLLKQKQLSTGKPTEIVEYKELAKKTPEELHTIMMGYLRGSSRN
jgi:hypothetical protein